MKKKLYEKPLMKDYELKNQLQLFAGSNPIPQSKGASIDDYEDGGSVWP